MLARIRNDADVPDVVQEVYLRMLRIPDAQSIRSPEAYLFTIARHVSQQYTLTRSTQLLPDELGELPGHELLGPNLDPALEAQARDCLEQLQTALDQLSPRARASFLLSRRDGLSPDEIAVRLGTTRSMVRKYLMKATIS